MERMGKWWRRLGRPRMTSLRKSEVGADEQDGARKRWSRQGRGPAGIKNEEATLAATKAQYATKQQAGVKQERKSVIVDRELDRLYKIHGHLTAEIVLNAAASPKNPLNPYFEWDDAEAAIKFRLQQATNLLLGSKMVVFLNQPKNAAPIATSHPVEVRRLVSAFRGEGFRMRNEVLNDADLRAAMIEKKIGNLRGWCDETVDITELQPLRQAILKVLPP